MTRIGWLATLGLSVFIAPAAAQTPLPPERPRDIAPSDVPRDKAEPPAYQLKLERLAELMGRLAYLRESCPPGDGAVWRSKMQDLLSSEGTSPERRNRLAGSFNRGYDGYKLSYRSCTPEAATVIEHALDEGSRLANEIATRFKG